MKVIIRVDDVTPTDFMELSEWFRKYFPSIPVCCYVHKTNSRWTREAWRHVGKMIINYNWEIGGHTRNHPFLSSLTEEEIHDEISMNIKDIEIGLRDVGLEYKVTSFAYPFGDYDNRVKNVLKKLDVFFGLTYPDAYAYNSLLKIGDPYEVGISADSKIPLKILNNRFLRAIKESDIYCFCLHPQWYPYLDMNILWSDIRYFFPRSMLSVMRRTFNSEFSLDRIFSHIKFIEKFDKINFTTFKKV